MATAFELTAELRLDQGKGASRRLRRLAEKVPGIIYGGGEPATSLSFSQKELRKALENEAFYSHILTIHMDGKPQKAVLKALQRHPYKAQILHLDLLRITGKEKIQMQVPLHFKGEDAAPGVKVGGGVVSHNLSTVEVRCLPDNLPEYIEVDVSGLELDAAIHLSQLKLPKGVELVALSHGVDADHDLSVVSVHIPRATPVEEETAAPVASEVPAIAQTAPEKASASEKEKGKG
jgi:large subunit ribosomal protein L25